MGRLKQKVIDLLCALPMWAWQLLPLRVRLWCFMNDGGAEWTE
jgi:hypothetical protein